MKKGIIFTFAALLFVSIGAFGAYFLSVAKGNKTPVKIPSTQVVVTPTVSEVSPTPTPTPVVTQTSEDNVDVPSDWSTYTNSTYGFSISFPANYQVLDSSNDLYGWPNGVALLYNGGQAYDITIEVWDSETEYEAKYTNQPGEMLVKNVGDKYVTVVDQTLEGDAADIISTFEVSQ